MLDWRKQLDIIKRGTIEIVPEEELVQKLKRSTAEDRPLQIKLGLDPTAPDIHLGHTVVLQKIRQFQELGHEVTIILGDFTGRIGDPSGKSETRKQLTESEISKNAETYKEQIFKVIDPAKTRVVFNSQWLAPLTFADVVQLAAKTTVARILERDDFARRFKEGLPISVHEFFYPLMQGYDSVFLRSDVELGGTDQKFNLLMGRNLQREYGLEPQVALMMPILEGLDGVQKMSKSLGNYVGINEPPREMFGKIMSLSDELMVRYFELVTPVSLEELRSIEGGLADGSLHPRSVKVRLAKEIVQAYYGAEAADGAEAEFNKVFRDKEIPDEIPEVTLLQSELKEGRMWLPKLLVRTGLAPTTGEARRLVGQGGVRVDDVKVDDPELELAITDGIVLKAGKRKFARVRVNQG